MTLTRPHQRKDPYSQARRHCTDLHELLQDVRRTKISFQTSCPTMTLAEPTKKKIPALKPQDTTQEETYILTIPSPALT